MRRCVLSPYHRLSTGFHSLRRPPAPLASDQHDAAGAAVPTAGGTPTVFLALRAHLTQAALRENQDFIYGHNYAYTHYKILHTWSKVRA
eukprot:COSAG02_NODE_1400_length_12844_cov_5.256493_6_plen_89_part_00